MRQTPEIPLHGNLGDIRRHPLRVGVDTPRLVERSGKYAYLHPSDPTPPLVPSLFGFAKKQETITSAVVSNPGSRRKQCSELRRRGETELEPAASTTAIQTDSKTRPSVVRPLSPGARETSYSIPETGAQVRATGLSDVQTAPGITLVATKRRKDQSLLLEAQATTNLLVSGAGTLRYFFTLPRALLPTALRLEVSDVLLVVM